MNKLYRYIGMAVLSAGSLPALAQTTGSYVPAYQQEQSNWCWAASSAMLYWAYGSGTQSQCNLVNVSRNQENAAWFGGCGNLSSSTTSACSSPLTFNSPQSIYGCAGSIESILDNWSISSTGYGYAFSASQVASATAARKHMVARWGWNSGGGHFVVIYRYTGGNVYFNNPAYGSSYIWTYATFSTANNRATWTHTLRMDNAAKYGSVYTTAGKADLDVSGITAAAESGFSFYPNPASKRLNCVVEEAGDREGSLLMFNALGQLQYSAKTQPGKNTFSIDISAWRRGLYLVKMESTGETKKLTVQ